MFLYKGMRDSSVRKALETAEQAFYVALQVHQTQLDKGGRSYIYHPLSLCFILTGTLSTDPNLLRDDYLNQTPVTLLSIEECDYAAAALLHDVVEDTPLSIRDLRNMGFSPFTLSLVDTVTRKKGESYPAYIDRVALHPDACLLKVADLLHNCNLDRLSFVLENDLKRRKVYVSSFLKLWSVVQSARIPNRIVLPEEFERLSAAHPIPSIPKRELSVSQVTVSRSFVRKDPALVTPS